MTYKVLLCGGLGLRWPGTARDGWIIRNPIKTKANEFRATTLALPSSAHCTAHCPLHYPVHSPQLYFIRWESRIPSRIAGRQKLDAHKYSLDTVSTDPIQIKKSIDTAAAPSYTLADFFFSPCSSSSKGTLNNAILKACFFN